jgi:hypothetical protein
MPELAVEYYQSAAFEPIFDNEAVTLNYDQVLQEVLNARHESEFWRFFQLFSQAERQLHELARRGPNWDSYGAEPPNDSAFSTDGKIVAMLRSMSVPPTRIVASSEGGVGICFVREDRYADFECFNTGEIVAVRYTGKGEPYAWDIAPEDRAIKAAIEQIRAYFSA